MKKIILSILLTGFVSYVMAQKSEVAEAKKKWSIFELTANSGSTPLEKKLTALNSGLLNTTNAINNEKTKGLADSWSYRSLFASAIAVTDTVNEDNSLANQKIAEEALEKAQSLDTKGTEKGNIASAEMNVRNSILLRGMRAYKKQDYETALKGFNDLITRDPSDTAMYLNAGVIAKAAKRYPEAIRHFKKVVELNSPDSKNVYNEMITMSLSELKDTTSAMELIKEALVKFPDDVDFIGNQTDIYISTGDIERSQELLKKLISKNASRPVYHYLMGDTYYKQALGMQEERNKIDVKNTNDFNAITAKMIALIDQSLPFYLKSLELDPKFVPSLETLKQIYGFKNETDKFTEVKKKLDAINAAN